MSYSARRAESFARPKGRRPPSDDEQPYERPRTPIPRSVPHSGDTDGDGDDDELPFDRQRTPGGPRTPRAASGGARPSQVLPLSREGTASRGSSRALTPSSRTFSQSGARLQSAFKHRADLQEVADDLAIGVPARVGNALVACGQPPSGEEMEGHLRRLKIRSCLNLRQVSESDRTALDNTIRELRLDYKHIPFPRTGWNDKMFDSLLAIIDAMRKPCLVFSATGHRALAVCIAHAETRYLCELRCRERLDPGGVEVLIEPDRMKLLEIVSQQHRDEGHAEAFVPPYIRSKVEIAYRRPLFARISKNVYAGPQLCESEIKELSAAGLRTVVCVRQYSEAGAFGTGILGREGELVRGLGMNYVHENVPLGQVFSYDFIMEARKWISKAKKPMLVHDFLNERVAPLYTDQPTPKKKKKREDDGLSDDEDDVLFVPKFNLTIAQICERLAVEAPKRPDNPALQRGGASKNLANNWVGDEGGRGEVGVNMPEDIDNRVLWRPPSPRRAMRHIIETIGMLVCSFAVGVVADLGKVALPVVIRGQFSLVRSHLLKSLCASGATSSLFFAILAFSGQPLVEKYWDPWRETVTDPYIAASYVRIFFGGAACGVGMAVGGTGPDLVLVQVGSGVPSSGFAFLGCWAGAAFFSFTIGTLKPLTNHKTVQFEKLRFMGCGNYTIYALVLAVLLGVWCVLLEVSFPWLSEPEDLGDMLWAPWISGLLLGVLQVACAVSSGQAYGGSGGYMAGLARLLVTRSLQSNFWLKQIEQYRLGRAFWMMRLYLACVVLGSYTSSVLLRTNNLMVGVSPWEACLGGFIATFGSRMAEGIACFGGVAGISALCVHVLLGACGVVCGGLAGAQMYAWSRVDFHTPQAFYDASGTRNASAGQFFLGI